MPKDFRATTLERAIGRQLAWWRNERGLSLTEAGQRVGFSSAKLSTMENAVQPSAALDIMALGYVYKVPAAEWQAVVVQAQHAAQARMRLQDTGFSFDPAADFKHLVFEAMSLCDFTTNLIPAVLQLPQYTDAAIRAEHPVRAERFAAVCKAWSTRLEDNDPLAVQVVFPETVLLQVVGGPRVMKAQLLHLIEVGEIPAVNVQVVPRETGGYPAMGSPFTLLGFPHRQHNDVVYLESSLKGQYVEDPRLVERCAQQFDRLQKVALSPGDSLELIAEAAAEL